MSIDRRGPDPWDAEKKRTIELAIKTFVSPRHAVRMLELNRSKSPAAQRKLRNMLGHFDGFRTELMQPYDPRIGSTISHLPRVAGQRDEWLVLSDGQEGDGDVVTLDRLLTSVLYRGFGVIAVNDPQRLAVYQGEELRSVRILFKPLDREGVRNR